MVIKAAFTPSNIVAVGTFTGLMMGYSSIETNQC